MQITATISVINPVVTGVSRSNGHEWRSQEVVLSWNKDPFALAERSGLFFIYRDETFRLFRGYI